MDDLLFGMKEIYDCVLKPTSNIEINNKLIEKNEPLLTFDSIQIMTINERKHRVDARGGYENQARVSWEFSHEVDINFSQGVMSKMQLAILGNSDLVQLNNIIVPKIERLDLETENDIYFCKLQHIPLQSNFFIYNSFTGERVGNGHQVEIVQIINNRIIFINKSDELQSVDVYYEYNYENSPNIITIGRPMINSYLSLSAKTRLKDDETGKIVTGIITIPKIKLMSDFSIRLGNDVPPAIGNFSVRAFPIGSKGNEKVFDFIVLNDDIDSDF